MKINPREGKLLYHLTSIDNVPSILIHGLRSRAGCRDMLFVDVADQEIVSKRDTQGLSRFVPFHFYPRNPFDWAVCRNQIRGSEGMAYVTVHRTMVSDLGLVVPSHPIGNEAPWIYSYENGFKLIEWDLMDTGYTNDPHARKVRMAEVLLLILYLLRIFGVFTFIPKMQKTGCAAEPVF